MKAYRFIGITLVSVDRNGNTRTDAEWMVDINPGSVTRFASKEFPGNTGIESLFIAISKKLARII